MKLIKVKVMNMKKKMKVKVIMEMNNFMKVTLKK